MRYLFIPLTLFLYVALSSATFACSCGYGGYWVSDFVKDKTIFEGRAVKAEWLGDNTKRQLSDHSSETEFLVSQPYWNVSKEKVTIGHNTIGASCGLTFSMGEKSIVIAFKYFKPTLHTNSCIYKAIDDITLVNYFESDIDVYIPSWNECTKEQIKDPDDSKNCHYLSDEAAQERRKAAGERRRAIWKKEQESKKALNDN